MWIFFLVGKKHVNLIYYMPKFGFGIFNFIEDKCIKDKCKKASALMGETCQLHWKTIGLGARNYQN